MEHMTYNEVSRFIDTYLSPPNYVSCWRGSEDSLAEIEGHLNNVAPFDHPDGYSVIGNEVLIVEHFEFDSSKYRKHKGSQLHREEARLDRQFNSFPPSASEPLFYGEVEAEYSMEAYRSNVIRVFLDHYKEIPKYIEALIHDGVVTHESNVKVLFLIEDVTNLGNIIEPASGDTSPCALVLPMCDFFLDFFEKSPDLDYVLCGSSTNNCNHLWFLDRSSISAFRASAIDTSKIRLINWSPKYLGYKIAPPNGAFDPDAGGSEPNTPGHS